MKKEDITGSWKLVSTEFRLQDGRVVYPMGSDAIGLLVYSAGGDMSVQIMSNDRRTFTSCDRLGGTTEEIKSAFEGYIAYFGTYEINREEGIIMHKIQGSLFPNWVGEDQRRFFELSGDRLTLRASSVLLGGHQMIGIAHWKRIE